MSAAAVVIIVTRPRPRPNGHETEEVTVNTVAEDTLSVADVLRQAADELDAGMTLPPAA